jgi:hypothetical protein
MTRSSGEMDHKSEISMMNQKIPRDRHIFPEKHVVVAHVVL